MNINRLLELATAIELMPHTDAANPFGRDTEPLKGFNMGVWRCGSVGCIGGWTNYLYPPADGRSTSFDAASQLGLDDVTADELFFPGEAAGWNGRWDYTDVTPAMAATVIRNLVDTGRVDWSLCNLPILPMHNNQFATDVPLVLEAAENPSP